LFLEGVDGRDGCRWLGEGAVDPRKEYKSKTSTDIPPFITNGSLTNPAYLFIRRDINADVRRTVGVQIMVVGSKN
jgi:hypothetical protein